jgi:hypothetical protein
MVWTTGGIGVCMAVPAVTSGTLMELLPGRGCLPGVTDAERVTLPPRGSLPGDAPRPIPGARGFAVG